MTTDKQHYRVHLNILTVLGQTKESQITVPATDETHAREVARYTAGANWPTAQQVNIMSVEPLTQEESFLLNAQLRLF